MSLLVIGGSAANGLHEEIASILGVEHVSVEYKVFPDGESYVRLPVDVSGRDVVIVQSTYAPQDKHLLELILLADAANDLGARSVTAVIPYLAYARQDRRFREGEAVSVKTVLKLLRSIGIDRLFVVEVHKEESLVFFNGPAYNVNVMDKLAEPFKDLASTEDVLVLAPDIGARRRAERFARSINAPVDYLEKRRDRVTGEVTVKPRELNVKDKVVIIVDDIISTGGTIALAASQALKQGAKKVMVACVHALLVGNAMDKLRNAGIERIVATNTVPVPEGVEVVSVAEPIARALIEL